jgi:hypothetical protein
MTRWLVFLSFCAVISCDDKAKPSPAASSTAVAAPDDPERLPAVGVKADSPPSYELSKLTENDLSTLIGKTGWKVTVLGKSAPDSKASRVRATAVKLGKDDKLESFTSVQCGGTDADLPAGSAFFTDDGCTLVVEVRRGIRARTEESRKLLMALLGASL